LASYCLVFILNFAFSWYLTCRFNLLDKKGSSGAWDRAWHILTKDKGMCVYIVYVLLELAYNIVIGVIWGTDTDCQLEDDALFTMVRVSWVIVFIFLTGSVFFGILTVCFDCCLSEEATTQEKESPKDDKKKKKKDQTTNPPPLPPKPKDGNPFQESAPTQNPFSAPEATQNPFESNSHV